MAGARWQLAKGWYSTVQWHKLLMQNVTQILVEVQGYSRAGAELQVQEQFKCFGIILSLTFYLFQ